MDCVDQALYRFPEHLNNPLTQPEATRKAFNRVFTAESDDAVLIMRYLIGVTGWDNEIVCSDQVFNSQAVALKGVMAGIKKQLNMNPIEVDTNE